jgi:hypothetical protein
MLLGGRQSLCAVARLGLRSPCQQRRAPRVLVRAPLARVLRLWNRMALTWARGRGCAAPPQGTTSAPTARQLWRPRSRRTRRSRRSASGVRTRALGWPRGMEEFGDAWAHGRGPPRRRAQCVGKERERAFARPRASGCARPASSVGPRAFSCELPLRACFGLESCGADLGSGSRVCCPAAANNKIGTAGATALAAALQKNTTVTAVDLGCARACSGGLGGWRNWGTLGPTATARRAGAPNVRGGSRERAFARPRASGCARPASSVGPRAFSCELPLRVSALNRVALTWARGRGCAAPPQTTTTSATTARKLWRPHSRRTRRSRRSNSIVRVPWGDGGVRGLLGPRPRPAAQARPICGEGEGESLCAVARLGLRSPCQQRRAPRVLVRASLARASAWNRVALTCTRGRGCAAPPQSSASAPPVRQLWRPRSRRTRRSRRSTSDVRKRARVAWGDGGVGRRFGPTAAARHAGAPNVRGGRRERAFARSRASGCARPASSVGPRAFSFELPLRAFRLGIVWR